MAIEGRKEAKENIRRKEEEVLAKRKFLKTRRRKTVVVDSTMGPTSGNFRQPGSALREGQHSKVGNENEGEGRGSPVSSEETIIEPPLVPLTVRKI